MGFWNSIKQVFRVADAVTAEAADGLEQRHQIAVSRLTLQEAKDRLQAHKLELGAYDGTRLTLEQDIDTATNELAQLEKELADCVELVKLGGEGAEEARQAGIQTQSEIADLKAKLAKLNAELDEANAGFDEMTAEIQELETFLEEEAKSIDSDEKQLALYQARTELAELKDRVAGDGDGAYGKLKEAADARRKLINQKAGQVRTAQQLAEKPAEKLRQRVRERVQTKEAASAFDALVQSQEAPKAS